MLSGKEYREMGEPVTKTAIRIQPVGPDGHTEDERLIMHLQVQVEKLKNDLRAALKRERDLRKQLKK